MTTAATRRSFLLASAGATAILAGPAGARPSRRPPGDAYPTTDPERAREIVGASHAKLERVSELLAEDAGLAKAAWDWGFGDWETALGAASHTGRKDIIEVLLAHGARPDLFTLTTLDQVDAVRAVVESLPGARALEGPHSISLYAHARSGEAARVLEYFESVGIADANPFAVERERVTPYFGNYAWGDGDRHFTVSWNDRRGTLDIARAGYSARSLMPVADHAFSPAGARHGGGGCGMEGHAAAALTGEGVGEVLRASRAAG